MGKKSRFSYKTNNLGRMHPLSCSPPKRDICLPKVYEVMGAGAASIAQGASWHLKGAEVTWGAVL